MFKNLPEKTFFFLMIVGAIVAFIGVFVFAFQLDEHNRPPTDMTVPFVKNVGVPVVEGQADSLAIQNMSSHEVEQKMTQIVAESLSFNASNYADSVTDMAQYFAPSGYAQYKAFLANAGFDNAIVQNDMQSGVYLERDPLELTGGVYGGVYKWVFEAPITISFIPRGSETYRDAKTKAVNRRFMLRIQFARIYDSNDPDAVKIEIWQALPPEPTD